MIKKLIALIALGLIAAGSAAAYTNTYSHTCYGVSNWTQWYQINAPSTVTFHSYAYCGNAAVSGGDLGVSGGGGAYDLWFGANYHPLTVNYSATFAASSYTVYFNFGAGPGDTAYASTTVSW